MLQEVFYRLILLIIYKLYTPEFSTGIQHVDWNENGSLMYIVTIDAKNWTLNTTTSIVNPASSSHPKNSTIIERLVGKKEFTNKHTIEKLYIYDNQLCFDGAHSYPHSYYNVELRRTGDFYQSKLYSRNTDQLLNDYEFIGGKIVAVYPKDSFFVISHYETTKKEKLILSCISLDGKRKLWSLSQSDMKPSATINLQKIAEPIFEYDSNSGTFFMIIKTFLYSINIKDGKVLWSCVL